MGAVHLGRDEVLGRAVALKRIGAMPDGGHPDLERAEREARLAARLNHPHVVAIYDLVSDGDKQWLVMEYVEGTNLAELVRANGHLSPDEAAPLIAQAADGLAAAHAAGIVHRDVKPSNMLVTPDGQLKLSDFGIARAEADASLTQTGLVTGSPAYLAPEIASGSTATEASDVWSLGAALYHALAGHPPYDVGENLMGALYRIVHEEPPRTGRAGWLAPLLESTMTHDPASRWSMTRVRQYLENVPGAGEDSTTQVLGVTGAAMAADDGGRGGFLGGLGSPPGHGAYDDRDDDRFPDADADPGDGEDPDGRRRRGFPWLAVLAAVTALALFGLYAFVAGLGGGDGGQPQAVDPSSSTAPSNSPTSSPGTPSKSPSQSPSKSPSQSPSATPAAVPSSTQMQAFVRTYLDTADADPQSGFALLTPGFQSASQGIAGYRGFWDGVSDVRLNSVSADPQALTVTYNYSYSSNGLSRTQTVSLALSYDPATGDLLIADEL